MYSNRSIVVVIVEPSSGLYHINLLFHKSPCSLMSRVATSPNSIVTAIANSDAYQLAPLMDMRESMLYVYRINLW